MAADDIILEFVTEGVYVHPERKWKMGLSKSDHEWLTEVLGPRAKNDVKWQAGNGYWRYLGSQPIPQGQDPTGRRRYCYKVRMMFRTKRDAMLFKLARVS